MADCTQCADYEWCAKNEECGMFKPKPITNYDRIRSMTDEELAEFLIVVGGCGPCHDSEYCKSRPRCEDNCWLDWLKQEVSTNG